MAQCREGTARSGSVLGAHRVDQGSTAGSGLRSQGHRCMELKGGPLQEFGSGGGGSGLEWRHRQSWAWRQWGLRQGTRAKQQGPEAVESRA